MQALTSSGHVRHFRHAIGRWSRLAACALPVALVACGGGGGADERDVGPPLSCSVPDQQNWLRAYMREHYFWSRTSPDPSPAGFATVADYYEARLFQGDSVYPADRWSASESTASFERFFGEGRTLGYGLAVNGLEVEDDPGLALRVRLVAPASPAAAAGIERGDRVVSIDGVAGGGDLGALVPGEVGEQVTLVLERGGSQRTVTLVAAVFRVTPVGTPEIVNTPLGRSMGYLPVQNMLGQAQAPLQDAFAAFRAAGVQDLVIDLRYNGGGLVSVARDIASYVAGDRAVNKVFTSLLYNANRAGSDNQTFRFGNPAAALDLDRVYILSGPRTCSASELLINGLNGVRPDIEVVMIGGTTCGKPVGFVPRDGECGVTYSAVNFETVNDRFEGRYFDGFEPTCVVADDLLSPLGAPGEALLAVARAHADDNVCPAGTALREQPLSSRIRAPRAPEPGERQWMIPQ